jgi:WG repeat protein
MCTHGAQLIPPTYERIGLAFQNGLVQVLENGKWGFADLEGRLMIPFVSGEQTIFQQGVAWIKTGAEWCPIDRRGDPIPNLACRDKGPGIDFARPHVCRVDKTGAW